MSVQAQRPSKRVSVSSLKCVCGVGKEIAQHLWSPEIRTIASAHSTDPSWECSKRASNPRQRRSRQARVPFSKLPIAQGAVVEAHSPRTPSPLCTAQCRLCLGRIKLMRNKRGMQVKQNRKEVAELLRSGKQVRRRSAGATTQAEPLQAPASTCFPGRKGVHVLATWLTPVHIRCMPPCYPSGVRAHQSGGRDSRAADAAGG